MNKMEKQFKSILTEKKQVSPKYREQVKTKIYAQLEPLLNELGFKKVEGGFIKAIVNPTNNEENQEVIYAKLMDLTVGVSGHILTDKKKPAKEDTDLIDLF